MIKCTKVVFLSMLLLLPGSMQAEVTRHDPATLNITAKAYALMDYHSGQILAEKDADMLLAPASITKLMASYVVSQALQAGNISLDDQVLISKKASRMEGSRSFIEFNSKVRVETLLRGMIVQSGNDATVALAEHVAGSEEMFAQIMNEYAQQLGMVDTNYMNATGLPDPEHYTSARDIAILSAALIRDFPEHYRWYSEKEFSYNGITQLNRNKLLWRDSSVDGIKTGHTEAAGYCLAASAKRGDMRLLSVVMGTDSENARAQESQKLLDYGFRFFETHRLYKASTTVTETKVWKGAAEKLALTVDTDLVVAVPHGRYDDLVARIHIQKPLVAPIELGTELGNVEIRLDDEVIASRPLVAAKTIEQGGWWSRLIDSVLLLIWG